MTCTACPPSCPTGFRPKEPSLELLRVPSPRPALCTGSRWLHFLVPAPLREYPARALVIGCDPRTPS
jgi:hypothetical protein